MTVNYFYIKILMLIWVLVVKNKGSNVRMRVFSSFILLAGHSHVFGVCSVRSNQIIITDAK